MDTALKVLTQNLLTPQDGLQKAFAVVAPATIRGDYNSWWIQNLSAVGKEHGRELLLCEYTLPPQYQTALPMPRTRQFIFSTLKKFAVKELWTFGSIANDDYREIVLAACLASAVIQNYADMDSTAYRYASKIISWQKLRQAKIA